MSLLDKMPKKAAQKAAGASSSRGASAKEMAKEKLKDRAIGPESSVAQVQAATGKKRRQLGRRDTEDQVQRCLDTHFKGVARSVLESKFIDGLNLRQRISRDLKAARAHPRTKRLGTCYWRDLRQQYLEHGEIKTLKGDEGDVVAPALKKALQRLISTNAAMRSSEPTEAWLRATVALCRKECIGIATMLLEPKLLTKQHTVEVVLALASAVTRLSLQKKMADIMTLLLDLVDDAVTGLWRTAQRSRVQVETFIEARGACTSVLGRPRRAGWGMQSSNSQHAFRFFFFFLRRCDIQSQQIHH